MSENTAVARSLPNSQDAEQGVLGSMLISPVEVIGRFVEIGMTANWFYLPAHSSIYKLLIELWEQQKPADFITLTGVLRDRKMLDSVGGPAVITHLFTFTPTAANADYYAEIIKDKYILRQMISVGTMMASRAYEDQGEVNMLLDSSETSVLGIRDTVDKGTKETTIKEHVMEAIEAIEMLYDKKGALAGLSTGLKMLDQVTGGMRPSEMIVIAARPSMGKTALGMNIVEHVTLKLQKPVGVFSLEMSAAQLTQRALTSRARVSLTKLRNGILAERDFPALTEAAGRIAESRLYIDDTSGLPINELRAKARRWHRDYAIELIMIDYLQLLKSPTKRAMENRQQEVTEISQGIKELAKELQIPIIVLAQLNRNPEGRASGKPRLSDLRESGSIEQDSDVVGLLMRAEYYAEDQEAKQEVEGEATLDIAKNRNGAVGEIELTFLKEFTRFEDRAIVHQPAQEQQKKK